MFHHEPPCSTHSGTLRASVYVPFSDLFQQYHLFAKNKLERGATS